jgi:secreted trypsin-like serine protease
VALLFTKEPFDHRIAVAVLASTMMIDNAKIFRAVGFGLTQDSHVGQKMMVDIPVASIACQGSVSTRDGQAPDASYYGCSAGFELVAGAPLLNKDTCSGDSGGPLFVQDSSGHDYLAATTSRGVGSPNARACGDGGIYVRSDGAVAAWMRSKGI